MGTVRLPRPMSGRCFVEANPPPGARTASLAWPRSERKGAEYFSRLLPARCHRKNSFTLGALQPDRGAPLHDERFAAFRDEPHLRFHPGNFSYGRAAKQLVNVEHSAVCCWVGCPFICLWERRPRLEAHCTLRLGGSAVFSFFLWILSALQHRVGGVSFV